jgi:hypothetical protein
MMNTTRRKMPNSSPKAFFRLSRNNMITTRSSGRMGRARKRSVTRIRRPSSFRKKPERIPISVPRNRP